MSFLLCLPAFVILPPVLSRLNVVLLVLLGSTRDENHERIAVLAEIDAVARSEIDPAFEYACADTLHIRKVAHFHTRQRSSDLGCRRCVQTVEPAGERASAGRVEVLSYDDGH